MDNNDTLQVILPNESLGKFHLPAVSCFNSSIFVFKFTLLTVIGIVISEFICNANINSMVIIIE
jgi:hypothetical protein